MTELKRAGLIKATKAEVDAAQFVCDYYYYDIEVYMSYGDDVDYSDPDLYCSCKCYLIDNIWYYEVNSEKDYYILSECTDDMVVELYEKYKLLKEN